MISADRYFRIFMIKSSPPIHSVAVALLAIAVIVLAIKEPRCDCQNDLPSVETPSRQQDSVPRPSKTGRSRELRKF